MARFAWGSSNSTFSTLSPGIHHCYASHSPHYPSVLGWLFRLVTHQGIYGGGSEGFTTSQQFASNFEQLWTTNFTLFIGSALIVLSLCVLLLLLRDKFSSHMGRYAIALGLVFQIALIFYWLSSILTVGTYYQSRLHSQSCSRLHLNFLENIRPFRDMRIPHCSPLLFCFCC